MRASVALVFLAVVAVCGFAFEMQEIPGFKTKMAVIRDPPHQNSKPVKKGDTLTVHATGIVQATGKQFWSTEDPGQEPFTFQVGLGKVITGWDQGCLGARLGEKRRLEIPPEEGYGEAGFPAWGIPPNGVLVFEVEILKIGK